MRVTSVTKLKPEVYALITGEQMTSAGFANARSKQRIRIAGTPTTELKILSVEIVLFSGGREFLSFLVPNSPDVGKWSDFEGREAELL